MRQYRAQRFFITVLLPVKFFFLPPFPPISFLFPLIPDLPVVCFSQSLIVLPPFNKPNQTIFTFSTGPQFSPPVFRLWNKCRLYFHEILWWHRLFFCIKAWRMGLNIGCINLLSGHLHGCMVVGWGGRGRRAPASRGESSTGGWHVTAVTVVWWWWGGVGGGAGRRLAAHPPWSNYATQPPVRPSSLTPATLRTVLISCQEDQLPSLTILRVHRRLHRPHHYPHLRHPFTYSPYPLSCRPGSLKSGYGIQVRRERRSAGRHC